jgi:hypothetical protein
VITFTSTVSIMRGPATVFSVLTDCERCLARRAMRPVAGEKTTVGDALAGTRFVVTAKAGILRVDVPHSWSSLARPHDDEFAPRAKEGVAKGFISKLGLSPDRLTEALAAETRSACPELTPRQCGRNWFA